MPKELRSFLKFSDVKPVTAEQGLASSVLKLEAGTVLTHVSMGIDTDAFKIPVRVRVRDVKTGSATMTIDLSGYAYLFHSDGRGYSYVWQGRYLVPFYPSMWLSLEIINEKNLAFQVAGVAQYERWVQT